jgi:hypothetical protein
MRTGTIRPSVAGLTSVEVHSRDSRKALACDKASGGAWSRALFYPHPVPLARVAPLRGRIK